MLQPPLRQVIARRNWFGSSSAIPGSSNVPPFVPLPPTIRMACTTPCIAFIEQVAKHCLLHGISGHGTPPPSGPAQALFWTHTLFLQWHFFYFGCIRPSPPLPPTPSLAILKILCWTFAMANHSHCTMKWDQSTPPVTRHVISALRNIFGGTLLVYIHMGGSYFALSLHALIP